MANYKNERVVQELVTDGHHDAVLSTSGRHNSMSENTPPPGLKKDWATVMAQILGVPLSWTRRAPLQYTDPQVYPIREASRKVTTYRRVDSVLSVSGLKFEKLQVQATDSVQDQANSTWERHSIAPVTNGIITLSNMALVGKARFDAMFAGAPWLPYASWSWYFLTWIIFFGLWVTWFAFYIIYLCMPCCSSERPNLFRRNYLPFYYNNDRYARIAANPQENRKQSRRLRYDQPLDGTRSTSSLFKPRMLLRINGDKEPTYDRNYPPNAEYLFVAFNLQHFPMENKPKLDELIRIGNKVAQKFKFRYFWVSASCMEFSPEEEVLSPEAQKQIEERDIYGISDTIRGASKVIIVLPGPRSEKCPTLRDLIVQEHPVEFTSPAATSALPYLREWSARVWTFPEVLLGPDITIDVCWRNHEQIEWYSLRKEDFPAYAWNDSRSIDYETLVHTDMQMVRHYKDTAMTRLEFVKIAMTCLVNRQRRGGVSWWYPGDLSYVLMGFLRVRPPINKYDSSLQAFARLSLPADNDRLMERFLCLQWESRESDWASMDDKLKADLWSVQPSIQISGIGENDTIIIEKAYGARIELKKFEDVSAVTLGFWRRMQGYSAGQAISADLAGWMREHYSKAKYERVIPRLSCFEGFLPIDEIEEKIFGARVGYLRWSTNASTLSKHQPGNPVWEPRTHLAGDKDRTFAGLPERHTRTARIDVEAQDGTGYTPDMQLGRDSIEAEDGRIATYPMIGCQPWVPCRCHQQNCVCGELTDRQLEAMGRSDLGKDKIFTLIDTATMTVTLLTAAWPPQALIACGFEGGMERVLACSYDWTTGVLYKECVLRLPGAALERMHRLPGLRLGFRRTLESADIAPQQQRRRGWRANGN